MPTIELPQVLYADNDDASADAFTEALADSGIAVQFARNGADALLALQRTSFDLVVADFDLPGLPGVHLLRTVGERWPDIPVIVMSAAAETSQAVEAVRAGAADFLSKPLDAADVSFTVSKALAQLESSAGPPPPSALLGGGPNIIGNSQVMRDLMSLVTRAASAGIATVLVRGESGTGKELLARRVHDGSPRAARPFVKVHCAALPEQLLESELFGYEKGAFTGAASRKPGRVELAEGGTLFLDEIGDITPATQVKLLRIIQDREFERLGGTETLKADVRFVTATHRNLEQMVKDGQFRQDLYYRLNVVQLVAPPLRDRREDIPALVMHFCASVSVANGRSNVAIDPEGVDLLAKYDWPGNVRQLQNFVERLVVLAETDVIEAGIVRRELNQLNMAVHREPTGVQMASVGDAGEITFGASVVGLEVAVRRAERKALEKALKKSGGNRTVAARILGVSRRTLYNKLQEHDLT